VGIRPGEKLHESLITGSDARHTLEFDNYYIIQPEFSWWRLGNHKDGKPIEEDFEYTSDKNEEWLTVEEMREMLKQLQF